MIKETSVYGSLRFPLSTINSSLDISSQLEFLNTFGDLRVEFLMCSFL